MEKTTGFSSKRYNKFKHDQPPRVAGLVRQFCGVRGSIPAQRQNCRSQSLNAVRRFGLPRLLQHCQRQLPQRLSHALRGVGYVHLRLLVLNLFTALFYSLSMALINQSCYHFHLVLTGGDFRLCLLALHLQSGLPPQHHGRLDH